MILKKISFVLFFLYFFLQGHSQSLNDYRSIANGNWNNANTWEVFDGTNWVAATNFPGEVAGANDVFIESGFSVTLFFTIANSFNSLTVGDGIGATDRLLITADSFINTQLLTIADGGTVEWPFNSNIELSFPANSAIVIIPSGMLVAQRRCNAAQRINIGGVRYSVCNGAAGTGISFNDLNNSGGSLNANPSSNEPICTRETLNLFTNPSGFNSDNLDSISWSATGPAGYSFNSSDENPVITGLIAGNYTYTVTITSGSISNTDSVSVIVGLLPDPPTTNGNQTICSGNAIPALSASVLAGETVD